MFQSFYHPNYWYYFKGGFLYRVHPRLRKAIKILISIVIGALILGGLYLLFKDSLLPELQKRIMDLFNYQG